MFAFIALNMNAQINPNRLIVVEKNGSFKGFLTERIDSMFFDKIEAPVRADVKFNGIDMTDPDDPKINVDVIRTKECWTFRIAVITKAQSDAWKGDASIASYFDQLGGPKYNEDFKGGTMSGMEIAFTPGGEYTLITMGYDHYGIACEASRADFKVPEQQAEGQPSVSWTIDDLQADRFTLTMTPNDDCVSFYTCIFGKGEAQAQYDQWAPMFGFSCMGDMIKSFSGTPYYSEKTQTWKDLAPNTEYEVYILPCDADGIFGEMVIANITTKKMGGEGVAEMTITVGDSGYEVGDDGQRNYWQRVIYTPNDQCSAHRDMMLDKSAIDDGTWTEEEFVEYMKNDKNPDYPDDQYWDMYGVDDVKWTVEPGHTYYVYSIAKNANNEWGPLAKATAVVPAATAPAADKNIIIPMRIGANHHNVLPGGKIIKKNVTLSK